MEATSPTLENVCPSEKNVEKDDSAVNNTSVEEIQSPTAEDKTTKITEKVSDEPLAKTSDSVEPKVVDFETETEKDANAKNNVHDDDGDDNDDDDDDDDDEAMIVEPQPSIPIDVDEEVSSDELIAFDESSAEEVLGDTSFRSANTSTENTKATEFVIVNTANVACIDSEDDTETIVDRLPLDIHIKDELAEPNIADGVSGQDVFENDPMDLLEPNDRDRSVVTGSTRSHDEPDEDEMSTSSSVKTGSSSTSNITDWVKDYPWLLYDEEDDANGYCLYCDANLNIKSHYYINKHFESLYHKERCDSYLAFREEEEKNGLCMPLVEIKQEFGTDSRVAALKLKRKTQTEALSNFNWRRWLEDCPWLERENPEGTIGRCKYCRIRLNVEFSYLRERHQETVKHKECEKQYNEESNDQDNNTTKNDSLNTDEITEEIASVLDKSKDWCEIQKDQPQTARCTVCDSKMIKASFVKHVRSNMHIQNVKEYLKELKRKQSNSSENGSSKSVRLTNWENFSKKHPWIVADPEEPKFAYCKYCAKRLFYGYSSVKRALHEKSSHHKYNEKLFHERARRGTSKSEKGDEAESENTGKNKENDVDAIEKNKDGDDEDEEENEDEQENEDEEEEEENEDETNDQEEQEEQEEGSNEDEEEDEEEDADNDEEEEETEDPKKEDKKDLKQWVPSDEWVKKYAWCKRYKDPKLIYCSYCKLTFSIYGSRVRHEKSATHIAAIAKMETKNAKKQEKRNQTTDYEWVVILRNIPNMYSCKYCRVRISNNYSKKSHAASKIHQINENLYLGNSQATSKPEENAKIDSSQASTTATQPLSSPNSSKNKKIKRFGKVKVIKSPSFLTLIKQWQKRFPWLSYKRSEMRSNYGHCKLCNTSLFIRSLKHVIRHTRSSRHLNSVKTVVKDKAEPEQKPNTRISAKALKEELPTLSPAIPAETITTTPQQQPEETTTQLSKELNYNATIAELQKRFSWLEKSNKHHYAFCRYCKINFPVKILSLRNHGVSVKHRQAVINYSKANQKGNKNQNETEASENTVADEDNDDDNDNVNEEGSGGGGEKDDDVMVVEENNEEILISEQDENWEIKSEPMDEHEELDYLLQRSLNKIGNKRNSQRNSVRKSLNTTDDQPSKRIKRSQSFRRLNDSNTSLVASLLSTPLTLASCLGPLIQQQIQQATSTPTSAASTSSAQVLPVGAENTYDLFFKSISETMKKLPVDLAAEGKVKVMQIICDLELQALKRQQMTPACDTASNSSSTISYTPTSSTVLNAVTGHLSTSHDVYSGNEHNGQISDTIITPIYTNTNVSPPLAATAAATTPTAPIIPTPTPTSTSTSTNVNMEQNTSAGASPVIGVMDKHGLQTLHLKPSMSKQIPKVTSTPAVTTASSGSSIRCIPFKNLSQTMSAGETNQSKYTRVHVPPSTAQSPNTNVTTTTSTPKGVINFRNIQITKRTAPQTSSASTQSSSAVTTVTPSHIQSQSQHQYQQQQQQYQQQHQQYQQQQQKPAMVNKSPQRTYITNIQPQLQRWGCTVNGASPNQTISPATMNNQLSKNKTSTPITKKYN